MRTIGKYKILGLLGRGGMAKVYRVSIPVIEKVVALKYLDPHPHLVHLLGKQAIHRLFLQEATLMAKIRHPHVASVLDFGEANGRLFYLMEYHCHNLGAFIGETYRTETPSRPIPVDNAIEYTRQILSGLERLHLSGVVHRDMKPYNILIDNEENLKICDFGLSRLRGESLRVPAQLKVGSPYYTAPEQSAFPDHAEPAADIFSVGVMLYRMLAGALPRTKPVALGHFNPDLDPLWDEFLWHCIDPGPDRRFQSASKMINALDAMALHWEKKKSAVCLLQTQNRPEIPAAGKWRLRCRPEKISQDRARGIFELDRLWRPRRIAANSFTPFGSETTLRDRQTGLLWEKGGWPCALTWAEAVARIGQMNRDAFGGIRCWRIPTLPEILTIMRRPPKAGDLCLPQDFDPGIRWLWSADRRTYTSQWYVNMELGYVGYQDRTALLHLKAVAASPGPCQ